MGLLAASLALGCGAGSDQTEPRSPGSSAGEPELGDSAPAIYGNTPAPGDPVPAGPAQLDQPMEAQPAQAKKPSDRSMTATAEIKSVRTGDSVGTLTFKQRGKWVTLTGSFNGLPVGERGIQIKTNGSCNGRGAKQAGPDFNPTDSRHGPPSSGERHVGDFGNIKVAKDGTAEFEMTTDSLTVAEGPPSVLNRSVVITARKDDGKTQPSGNAGPAIACGVVKK
jgi:Cu-Zn family superoxide dismutase